jgi:hypothetical protein
MLRQNGSNVFHGRQNVGSFHASMLSSDAFRPPVLTVSVSQTRDVTRRHSLGRRVAWRSISSETSRRHEKMENIQGDHLVVLDPHRNSASRSPRGNLPTPMSDVAAAAWVYTPSLSKVISLPHTHMLPAGRTAA